MIAELDYYAVHNVSIAHDDEQIEAHKIWLDLTGMLFGFDRNMCLDLTGIYVWI